MIENTFLNVEFTKITLLHILILLGIPYIIFYFFEKLTKFDKFIEKWEAALFIFTIGGIVTLFSIFFQEISQINFFVWYFLFIVIILSILTNIYFIFFEKQKENKKWIIIELNNKDRYKGYFSKKDSIFIQIGGTNQNPIEKYSYNSDKNDYEKPKQLNYKKISFKIEKLNKVLG